MTVAVLRFRAGPTAFALAAGSIDAVGVARPGIPHLAHVLGGEVPSPGDDARALRVAARGHRIEVIVDGPLALVELDVDDIAPCPIRAAMSSSVLGFARVDRVVVLLDAAGLVELVRAFATAGSRSPPAPPVVGIDVG